MSKKVNDDFTKFVKGIINEIKDDELATDLKKVAEKLGCTFNEFICKDCGQIYTSDNEKLRCPLCQEARQKWIERNLAKIENLMNDDYVYYEDTGLRFKLSIDTVKDEFEEDVEIIILDIIDENDEILHTYSSQKIFDTMEENIKSLIGFVYVEDINYRKRFINNFKGAFMTRKMKSLSIAISKGNTDKVNKINIELVERYKISEKYKNDINYYKMFVRTLYYVLDKLKMEV